MLDRYDLMMKYIDNNQQLSFCKYNKNNFSLLKIYCMWCEVNEFKDDEYLNYKEKFICEMTEGEGDALAGILREKDIEKQRSMIEFLYSDIDFLKKAYKLDNDNSLKDIVNSDRIKSQLDILENTDIASNILRINYDPNTNVKFHISCVEHGIIMYYFEKCGLFISVNIDFDLSSNKAISFDDKLLVYKALADESRLKIVEALTERNMTPAQLSQIANVTLSTVNHHLKKLCECGLVRMDLSKKLNKGVYFLLNKEFINNLIGGIKNEIQ